MKIQHSSRLSLALASLLVISAPCRAAESTDGNLNVNANTATNEPGDLDVDGNAHIGGKVDFGTTTETNPQAAVYQLYDESGASYTARFRTARDMTSVQWEQNGTTGDRKMLLTGDNSLKLFKYADPANAEPMIVLNAATGTVEVKGGIKIKQGANNLEIRADASGNLVYSGPVVFNDQVKFDGGIVVPGSQQIQFGEVPGANLNVAKATYLDSTLKNLGYIDAPPPTPVIAIDRSASITISNYKAAGSGIFVVGYTYAENASIGGQVVPGEGSGQKAFVAKLNASGQAIWVTRVQSTDNVVLNDLAPLPNGGVVISGTFSGETLDMGANNQVALANNDAIVISLGASGVVEWTKTIGGPGYESVPVVAVDSNGNVVVAGGFNQGITTLGSGNLPNWGSYAYLVRFSATGSWISTRGLGQFITPSELVADNAGNIYIAGHYSFYHTGGDLYMPNSGSGTMADGFCAKYNSAGRLWVNHFGSAAASESVNAMAIDGAGNVYLAGEFEGSMAVTGLPNLISAPNTYQNGYLLKTNSSGVAQWVKSISSTGNDALRGLAVDSGNNIVVTGEMYGPGLLEVPEIIQNGLTDAFLIRYSQSGTLLDAKQIGSVSTDSVSRVRAYGSNLISDVSPGGGTFVFGEKIVGVPSLLMWPAGTIVDLPKVATTNFSWGSAKASGSGSTAFGTESYAEGIGAVSLGSAKSLGDYAFASGGGQAIANHSTASGGAKASGAYSTAFGDGSEAVGYASTALGSSYAAGDLSVAWGSWSGSMGYASTAWGEGCGAYGDYSTAWGLSTAANQLAAVSWGIGSIADGFASTSWGQYCSALGFASTSFGDGTIAVSYASTALGTYNLGIGQTPVSGTNSYDFVPLEPVVEFGNGTYEERSNALTTLKNGQTTLTNKKWKEHVAENETWSGAALADPDPESETDSNGNALVIEGHAVLKGRVIIEQPQGDISMGEFAN